MQFTFRDDTLPPNAYTEIVKDKLKICRIPIGLWQISGHHSYIPSAKEVIRRMADHMAYGFCTFDVSPYEGVSLDLVGQFRTSVGRTAFDDCQFLVRIGGQGKGVSRKVVEDMVDDVLKRTGVERIDLVQYEGGEWDGEAYIQALGYLMDLVEGGKIRFLGVSNFDTKRLRRAVEQGVRIASVQLCYSIVDTRPREEMEEFCVKHGIKILAYGALCGGFLSDRYVGLPEPTKVALDTPSLVKYKSLIDAWGGWGLFQELLFALRTIAEKYDVSVANVATQWLLRQKAVGAVIIGSRLGMSEEVDHSQSNARVFEFELDSEDCAKIDSVTQKSNSLFRALGDCGVECVETQKR